MYVCICNAVTETEKVGIHNYLQSQMGDSSGS